jgi:parallel beta-helix repeat protein
LTQTPAGGTVHVAAGTYAEQLTIAQNVTIVGAGSTKTIIEPSSVPNADTDTDSPTPQYAIVDVTSGSTASLQSLTVNGAAASGQFTGCGDDFVGVYFHDASGSLSSVDVTNIELTAALFGCQDGLGVYVATDAASTTPSIVAMSHVSVTNYDKNGITCDDIGTVCSITNSVVTGIGPTALIAQNGVQVFGASARIVDNEITANNYTNPNPAAIYASIGVEVINAANLTVSGNSITANNDNVDAVEAAAYGPPDPTPGPWIISDNNASNAVDSPVGPGDGLGDGIDVDSVSSDVWVTGNSVVNDPEFGIGLYGASNVVVSSNVAKNDEDGLYIGGPGTGAYDFTTSAYDPTSPFYNSTDNSIDSNTAVDNLQVGIYVDTYTSGNSLVKNVATGNATTDVVDASSGSGTKGTANTWSKTTCVTSSPVGLCSAKTVHPGPPRRPFHPPFWPPFWSSRFH